MIWPLVGYKEWRQDAPSRYRKAKDDICYWITDEWYSFESPMQKEIESAYQAALKKNDRDQRSGDFDPFLIKGLKYPVRNKSH